MRIWYNERKDLRKRGKHNHKYKSDFQTTGTPYLGIGRKIGKFLIKTLEFLQCWKIVNLKDTINQIEALMFNWSNW